MSIYEYNEEEVLKLIRKDERKEGRAEGMEEVGLSDYDKEAICKQLIG